MLPISQLGLPGAETEMVFKDNEKMAILAMVLVASFMIPIGCSCSTYLVIVAKKSRWAENSVVPAPSGPIVDLESGDSRNQTGCGSSMSAETVRLGDVPFGLVDAGKK